MIERLTDEWLAAWDEFNRADGVGDTHGVDAAVYRICRLESRLKQRGLYCDSQSGR